MAGLVSDKAAGVNYDPAMAGSRLAVRKWRQIPGIDTLRQAHPKEPTMTGRRLVVWYNTRCPVCNAGIDWQRSKLLAAVRAGDISYRDINEQPNALASFGVSLDDIRRRLHATDETGRLIVGADVAIAMWQVTPGEGWLASLFGNRLMLPLTRFVYDRFADVLFAWNRWKGHW
jgi:predicted DCC family thiol-disulfide oxidoreductase YuxK